MNVLNFSEHSRFFKDYRYIYPVVSRRAQGISLGLNLNPNNACNWRCIYCQVEGLVRGKPPAIDLLQLEAELDELLAWITEGDFIQRYAPLSLQRLNDICLSGNGEATLSPDFAAVVKLIAKLRHKYELGSAVKTILISNGSEMHLDQVQQGLKLIAANNGEVWFKIDRATTTGIRQVNQVALNLNSVIERLQIAASLCPCYVQSCWFKLAGADPEPAEVQAFVALMAQLSGVIEGVLLYSTARNPALPEGANISQVSADFLANLAQELANVGVSATYYV